MYNIEYDLGFAPGEFPPLIQNYPLPSNDNRASDWGPCVNSKRTGNENNETGNLDVFGNPENLSNQNWNECTQNEKDNEYTAVSLRMDWDLGNNMTLTSLTSISDYDREKGLKLMVLFIKIMKFIYSVKLNHNSKS